MFCDTVSTMMLRAQPDIVFLSDIVLEDNTTFAGRILEHPLRALVHGQCSPTLREYVEALGADAEGTIT